MDYGLPVLESSRIVLRPWTMRDVDELHRLWTGPGMRRYLWDDGIISRELAQKTVASSIESAARCGIGMWSVLLRGDPRAIGFCGFRFIDDPPEVEILFGLEPHCLGARIGL